MARQEILDVHGSENHYEGPEGASLQSSGWGMGERWPAPVAATPQFTKYVRDVPRPPALDEEMALQSPGGRRPARCAHLHFRCR